MKRAIQKAELKHGRRQRIGPAVRDLRLRREWTQAELANQSGLSVSQLSRIERGTSDPSYRTLCDLASILGVDIDYFTAFHQIDVELDRRLAGHFESLSIPPEHRDALCSLSAEARGALVDALGWLTGADSGRPLKERALEQQLLSHGVRDSWSYISDALAEFGLDTIELARVMFQLEQVSAERLEINDRLPSAALPVHGGIDPFRVFDASFAPDQASPRLVRWWAQATHSAVKGNAQQFPGRSIYPLRRIERYIETGRWGSGPAVAPPDVRRHIGSVIELLRIYPNYHIGLIDSELPFNLLIKGHQQTCLFVRPRSHSLSGEHSGVGLKFSNPGLVHCFRAYYEELWESIPGEWRDAAAVAAWLEHRLSAIPA